MPVWGFAGSLRPSEKPRPPADLPAALQTTVTWKTTQRTVPGGPARRRRVCGGHIHLHSFHFTPGNNEQSREWLFLHFN